ncbi:LYR motif-containing protein 9-like isoform X1 [Tachypleus tridentatus]|uniref:LYR motif-containing protein 9-like isoform X1 n=1 Tax=Tachypleus tridentatus TaxID=6853 RepID=UPI003FD0431D
MASYSSIKLPVHLYRFLLRQCKKLPTEAQGYYKHLIRQVRLVKKFDMTKAIITFLLFSQKKCESFNSHSDETEPERIQQIINRAIQDSDWVVSKYSRM